MNYLLIDTSNQPLSVAIMKDNEVIAEKQLISKESFSATHARNSRNSYRK